MDLEHMLQKCRRDQWKLSDLDWTGQSRPLSKEKEIAVVQYFTDMAAIERLAKALFVEQYRRAKDPVLKEIFETFIVDEERHAQCAQRLAEHYDVHGYRTYSVHPALEKFRPHFFGALKHLSADIANVYITAGELLLDVALLRSIDDYVDDPMSRQAMVRINRDESRHIAIDYYMVEHYCSPEYIEEQRLRPKRTARQKAQAYWAFAHVLFHAKPFFHGVFLEPIERADPSGRRVREALKRFQLLGMRPDVARRPFPRFINGLRRAYARPLVRDALGPVISRMSGVPGEFLVDLYSTDEAKRANAMDFDQLAADALQAKYID